MWRDPAVLRFSAARAIDVDPVAGEELDALRGANGWIDHLGPGASLNWMGTRPDP